MAGKRRQRAEENLVGATVLVPKSIWPTEPCPKGQQGWKAKVVGIRGHDPPAYYLKFEGDPQRYYFAASQVSSWLLEAPPAKRPPGRPPKAAKSAAPTATTPARAAAALAAAAAGAEAGPSTRGTRGRPSAAAAAAAAAAAPSRSAVASQGEAPGASPRRASRGGGPAGLGAAGALSPPPGKVRALQVEICELVNASRVAVRLQRVLDVAKRELT